MAKKDNGTAVFLSLDQEKAFDRVKHEFLFKTMKTFGIGDVFMNWVRTIYSNATSVLNINGHFCDKISLNSGVRQGYHLSVLLYVLLIEILAIQLWLNPKIVGFMIGGEK